MNLNEEEYPLLDIAPHYLYFLLQVIDLQASKNNLTQFYDKKHVDYFEVTSIQRIFAINQTVFDCKNEKAQGIFVVSF